MIKRYVGVAGTVILGLACWSGAAVPARVGQPGPTAQPVTSTESPYDESADAKEQIAAALARAKGENRRVLIQWGANWCSWCKLLDGLCASDRTIKQKLSYEYDTVLVDIGQWNKNMDLAASYEATLKDSGVPFLTVLSADGQVLANQETGSLEAANSATPAHDPKKVLDFLTKHQAPQLSAETVLSNSLIKAKAEEKKVFLHFGAPWCGWCHRLDDWMAREDVAPVLARWFVPVKIDQDRMTGATEIMGRYNTTGGQGIPWSVFLNAEGGAVITSDDPETGNIGFPAAENEVAHFSDMLKAAGVTDADVSVLVATLKQAPTSGGH
jgi:thiol:disulfide interchange protein